MYDTYSLDAVLIPYAVVSLDLGIWFWGLMGSKQVVSYPNRVKIFWQVGWVPLGWSGGFLLGEG